MALEIRNCIVCGRGGVRSTVDTFCSSCQSTYPQAFAAYQGQPEPQNGNTQAEKARSAAATERMLVDAFWPDTGSGYIGSIKPL